MQVLRQRLPGMCEANVGSREFCLALLYTDPRANEATVWGKLQMGKASCSRASGRPATVNFTSLADRGITDLIVPLEK